MHARSLLVALLVVAVGLIAWLWLGVGDDARVPAGGTTSELEPATLTARGKAGTSVESVRAVAAGDAPSPGVARDGEVVVRVLWRDDALPIVGLELMVTDAWRTPAIRASIMASTDAEGRVTFRLPAGRHLVMATNEYGKAIDVVPGERSEHELRLPRQAKLVGRVIDEDGVPIAGARVGLARGSLVGEETTLATTGADGAFAAQLMSDLAFVFAEKRGHGRSQSAQVRGFPGEEPSVELVLARATTTVRGVVVDEAERPIAGARVSVEGTPPPPRVESYSEPVRRPVIIADADGRFVAPDIPPGEGGVLAAAKGYAWAAQSFVAQLGQAVDVRIVLRKGPRVLGRVLDSQGQPVRGARVMRGLGGRPEITDAEGRFAFDVAPGKVELQAQHVQIGVAKVQLELADGETRNLEMTLSDAIVLEGRVVDEHGQPLPGMWVTSFTLPLPASATDTEGRFRFLGCPAAAIELEVRQDSIVDGPPLAQATVTPGSAIPDLVVPADAWPSAFLKLRVVQHEPERVCQLLVERDGFQRSDGVMLPRSGEVRIGPLAAGRYRVRNAYLRQGSHRLWALDLGPIDLAPGQKLDLGTHTLATPNALRLVVRRTDGSPVRLAQMTLSPAIGDDRPFRLNFNDRGRLYPESFPPGRYRLRIEPGVDHDAVETDVEIRAAHTTDLRLNVPPLRACRFTLTRPDGLPALGVVEATLRAGDHTPQRLRFAGGHTQAGLRVGAYEVVIDGVSRARFDVDALTGPPIRVTIAMP